MIEHRLPLDRSNANIDRLDIHPSLRGIGCHETDLLMLPLTFESAEIALATFAVDNHSWMDSQIDDSGRE
jgi:hypothetical protein